MSLARFIKGQRGYVMLRIYNYNLYFFLSKYFFKIIFNPFYAYINR